MFAVSKNNPHRGGILTCAHMLPPSSQRKSSQKRDFELGLHASHHLKNNPPKGRIPKRWDKNLVQEILPEGRIIDRILLIEGYLHVSTFYSVLLPLLQLQGVLVQLCYIQAQTSLRLTLDLLGPDSCTKGYCLYTSSNLSDPFFIIDNG